MDKQAILGSIIRGTKEIGKTNKEIRGSRAEQAQSWDKKRTLGRLGSALWDPVQTERMHAAQGIGTLPALEGSGLDGIIAKLEAKLHKHAELDPVYVEGFMAKCALMGVNPAAFVKTCAARGANPVQMLKAAQAAPSAWDRLKSVGSSISKHLMPSYVPEEEYQRWNAAQQPGGGDDYSAATNRLATEAAAQADLNRQLAALSRTNQLGNAQATGAVNEAKRTADVSGAQKHMGDIADYQYRAKTNAPYGNFRLPPMPAPITTNSAEVATPEASSNALQRVQNATKLNTAQNKLRQAQVGY